MVGKNSTTCFPKMTVESTYLFYHGCHIEVQRISWHTCQQLADSRAVLLHKSELVCKFRAPDGEAFGDVFQERNDLPIHNLNKAGYGSIPADAFNKFLDVRRTKKLR
eukprot:scpid26898/ scgid20137/ 